MDYKYFILRYQTFRREYLELSSKWLNSSWSWFWNFSIDICKYLYQGEINQIRYLNRTIKQKNAYIDFLRAHRYETEKHNPIIKKQKDTDLWHWLFFCIRLLLLPISFLVYWLRRITRIVLNRHYAMLVSALTPTEDKSFTSSFKGVGKVYIFPKDRQAFPVGLVIFRYTLNITADNPEIMLFIDPGVGFVSEYSIPLPYTKGEYQELLLEMPPGCSLMQFQVTTVAGVYELKDISMTEINVLQAVRYLKTRYCYGFDELFNTLFIRKLPGVRRVLGHKSTYAEWHYKYARLADSDHKAIITHIATFNAPPRISIVLSTNNSNPDYLDQCLFSLHGQLYKNWEVLITCSEHPDAHVTAVLNRYERIDPRFRIIINKQSARITANITDALEVCNGAFVAFIEQNDLLAVHALYLAACWVQKYPQAKLLYTDYDHIDEYGALSEPCLKPDWNYDFFLGKNYLQYAIFYNTDVLKPMLNEVQVNPVTECYRFNLCFLERISATGICHLPFLLLHHRISATGPVTGQDYLTETNKNALNEHLVRTGQSAVADTTGSGFRIRRAIPGPEPLVSLIVLTRDRAALLANCINGILHNTGYKNIEVIIIDNGSIEAATLDFLAAVTGDPRVRVIPRPSEFNFSELNNFAVRQAKGDYIGLINNDTSVIDPGWLAEMVSHLARPDVGIVGAKLLYENDTIQHAGVIIGLGGVAGHGLRHSPRSYRGYDDRLVLSHELSCVTAACLLTKKSVYQAVDGLDEINLRIAFNDVDYCLKVRQLGLKIIWTPFAELYHLESASRSHDLTRENIKRWMAEYGFMKNKWRPVLEYDPCYNPNLAINDEEFALAHPPRLVHPWERYRYISCSESIQ